MATPLTHIILTESIYDSIFSDSEKSNFFIGTLLPDIRYLDRSIPRDKFHRENMDLNKIFLIDSSFEQGVLFHSLLDQVRDKFYIEKGIYIPGQNEDFIIALKLLEDEILYNKIDNWTTLIKTIQQFDYTNIAHVNLEISKKRYSLLTQLMKRKPDDQTREEFMLGIGMSKEYSERINTILSDIKKNKKYEKLIYELYSSFSDSIKQ